MIANNGQNPFITLSCKNCISREKKNFALGKNLDSEKRVFSQISGKLSMSDSNFLLTNTENLVSVSQCISISNLVLNDPKH